MDFKGLFVPADARDHRFFLQIDGSRNYSFLLGGLDIEAVSYFLNHARFKYGALHLTGDVASNLFSNKLPTGTYGTNTYYVPYSSIDFAVLDRSEYNFKAHFLQKTSFENGNISLDILDNIFDFKNKEEFSKEIVSLTNEVKIQRIHVLSLVPKRIDDQSIININFYKYLD